MDTRLPQSMTMESFLALRDRHEAALLHYQRLVPADKVATGMSRAWRRINSGGRAERRKFWKQIGSLVGVGESDLVFRAIRWVDIWSPEWLRSYIVSHPTPEIVEEVRTNFARSWVDIILDAMRERHAVRLDDHMLPVTGEEEGYFQKLEHATGYPDMIEEVLEGFSHALKLEVYAHPQGCPVRGYPDFLITRDEMGYLVTRHK